MASGDGEMFSLRLHPVFPTWGNTKKGTIGSQLFNAERTGQLFFSHTFVWIFTCYA